MVETILKRISELINENKLFHLDVTDLTGTCFVFFQKEMLPNPFIIKV